MNGYSRSAFGEVRTSPLLASFRLPEPPPPCGEAAASAAPASGDEVAGADLAPARSDTRSGSAFPSSWLTQIAGSRPKPGGRML
jgi:hypothetical protein